MSLAHLLPATGAAFISAPIIAFSVARGFLAWREAEYRKAGKVEPPEFASPWTSLKAQRTPDEFSLDKAAKNLFMKDHEEANVAQTRAVRHLAEAGSLLFAAFVCFAFAVTLMKDNEQAHTFAAAFEAAAFMLVVLHFGAGKTQRLRWLAKRTQVEFLRVWHAVEFPLTGLRDSTLQRSFDDVRAEVVGAISDGFDPRVTALAYGKRYIAEIKARIVAMPALPREAVLYYVERRPIRQARWFQSAQYRLEGGHKTRGIVLFWLFVLAIVCAVGKFLLIAFADDAGIFPHGLEFLLLLAIGASSATTALMVGQNGRSLSHQYRRQLRDIERWLSANTWLLQRASASTAPLTGDDKDKFAKAVEEFELLMLHELLDWIHATEEDSMELSAV
jgi:hypothetical protein